MILVTGATGALGGRVARLLAEQEIPMTLMVREPSRAPDLPGARVVRGDYADPRSLTEAFRGIRIAFIVSGHAEPMKRAILHGNAFTAAAQAGVEHIVYTSFQGASPESKFPFARDHHQTEKYLREAGVPFTALRDNLYQDVVPDLIDERGRLRGPSGAGRAAWVAREDVARTAVALLSNPPGESAVYDLTGPRSLDMNETVAILSKLTGRELIYEDETVEEGRAWRSTYGAPEWEVGCWLGSYEAIAAGELEQTSDAVRKLTGREPMDIEEYLQANPALLDSLRRK